MRLFPKLIAFITLLLGACHSNGKLQPIPADKTTLLIAAREIIQNSGKCAFITLDKNGHPQARTMDAFEPDADFTIWMATNPKSRKVDQIKSDPRVTIYYSDKNENGYVSIYGMAEIINDQQEKDKRWKDEWRDFYANRTDGYLLIKITPIRLEVINYSRDINGNSETWQPATVYFTE